MFGRQKEWSRELMLSCHFEYDVICNADENGVHGVPFLAYPYPTLNIKQGGGVTIWCKICPTGLPPFAQNNSAFNP